MCCCSMSSVFAIILHFRFRLRTIVMILLLVFFLTTLTHSLHEKEHFRNSQKNNDIFFFFVWTVPKLPPLSVTAHLCTRQTNSFWLGPLRICAFVTLWPFFHSPLLRPLMTARVDAGLPHKRLIINQSFSRVLLSIWISRLITVNV